MWAEITCMIIMFLQYCFDDNDEDTVSIIRDYINTSKLLPFKTWEPPINESNFWISGITSIPVSIHNPTRSVLCQPSFSNSESCNSSANTTDDNKYFIVFFFIIIVVFQINQNQYVLNVYDVFHQDHLFLLLLWLLQRFDIYKKQNICIR